jgi:hypothetical protein
MREVVRRAARSVPPRLNAGGKEPGVDQEGCDLEVARSLIRSKVRRERSARSSQLASKKLGALLPAAPTNRRVPELL